MSAPTIKEDPQDNAQGILSCPPDIIWALFTQYIPRTVAVPSVEPRSTWQYIETPHHRFEQYLHEYAVKKRILELRLVCKQWADVGSPVVFREIEIGYRSWDKKHLQAYKNILSTNEILRKSVQSISYNHDSMPLSETEPRATVADFIDTEAYPNVTTLEISACKGRFAGKLEEEYINELKGRFRGTYRGLVGSLFLDDARVLPPWKMATEFESQARVNQLLYGYLRSGTLTTLKLVDVGAIPIYTILSCPSLVELWLINVYGDHCEGVSNSRFRYPSAYGHEQRNSVFEDTDTDITYSLRKLRVEAVSMLPYSILQRCTKLEEIELESKRPVFINKDVQPYYQKLRGLQPQRASAWGHYDSDYYGPHDDGDESTTDVDDDTDERTRVDGDEWLGDDLREPQDEPIDSDYFSLDDENDFAPGAEDRGYQTDADHPKDDAFPLQSLRRLAFDGSLNHFIFAFKLDQVIKHSINVFPSVTNLVIKDSPRLERYHTRNGISSKFEWIGKRHPGPYLKLPNLERLIIDQSDWNVYDQASISFLQDTEGIIRYLGVAESSPHLESLVILIPDISDHSKSHIYPKRDPAVYIVDYVAYVEQLVEALQLFQGTRYKYAAAARDGKSLPVLRIDIRGVIESAEMVEEYGLKKVFKDLDAYVRNNLEDVDLKVWVVEVDTGREVDLN